jgi:large subunit ribosomal protein L21
MLAVIKTGGKQYVVKEGDVLHVEKLGTDAGGTILFEEVFLIDDDGKTLVGTPVVPNAVVKAAVLATFRDEKVLIFKKKRRKQFRRTRGHRQSLAKVQIQKIYPDRTVVPAGELDLIAAPTPKTAPAPVPAKPKAKINKATPKPKVEKPAPVKPAKQKKAAAPVKPKARAKKAEK